MPTTSTSSARRWPVALRRGALAGALASGASLAFRVIALGHAGTSPWLANGFAALPVLGARALRPAFEPGIALVALGMQLALGAAWGAPFGALVARLPRLLVVPLALGWAALVGVAMYKLVLPAAGLAMVARSVDTTLVRVEHAVFGIALGLASLPIARRAM